MNENNKNFHHKFFIMKLLTKKNKNKIEIIKSIK